MDTIIEFSSQISISENKVKEIEEKILDVIKKELPEEVLSFSVICFIFDEIKDDIKLKSIRL